MYIPAAFLETDNSRLHEFIEQNSFGLLVSQMNGAPFVTHLPFLLERAVAPQGCLLGHMARANPQWEHATGQMVLAVFSGPHAYISPTWYEAEQVVPTWNYTTVHVYGRFEPLLDSSSLLDLVQKTVQVHERVMPRPWFFDGSAIFVERLLAQIIGFRIEIAKLDGKWKLNQNHPVERREKVIRVLEQRSDDNSQAIASMMRQGLPTRDGAPDDLPDRIVRVD